MKRILYIGNHLSLDGAYPSVGEIMDPLLKPEVSIQLISRKIGKLSRLLDMLIAILRFGKQEQPVLIDVYSTYNFYYALISGITCQLLSIEYYCILHGGNLPRRLANNPVLSKILFGHSSVLISPSGYLQHEFGKAGYNTTLIPNFVPINQYTFHQRKIIQPKLLWVRAFDSIYNPSLAIQILEQLRITYPEATLCMVGPDRDGSMESCKALAANIGLSNHITFTGQLTKREWHELSTDYDVFINTTNFDNMPISLIEIMALGLPIVSTNVGGLPYLIEEGITGLLCPPNEVTPFVVQITRLLEDADLTFNLSLAGRDRAESFAWEKVKPLWLDILQVN